MSKQLELFLAEIDREATKAAVEASLEKYRLFLLTQTEEMTPKITAAYSMLPPAPNNQFHSSTEDMAIERADREAECYKYIKWITRAVNRLSYVERSIIVSRYMIDNEVYDYQIYNRLGMSQRQYYRIKSTAFYKLALALKIEVYVNKEEADE
ncbi:ArpU family transcriptional regulator [Bacillaceae bacterium SAOS 7]|nr:ArpU family transcriptional regulator [Bacillaceae bacterium SAOS 7]